MANVNFTISPAPGIINDMIAVLYEILPGGGIGAEIDRLPIPAPHDNPQNLSFTNVEPHTYIVKIHETTDGITLGNLRHDFWVDASLQKLQSYTVKTFQVGAGRGTPYFDPADQDDDYINTDLDGLTYTVFKPGYAPLDWDANINIYTGGGFSYIDGQKFSQDEIYTILISNLVAQPLTTGGGSPFIDGIEFIAGNVPITTSHYRKMIMVNDSTSLTLTIADLNAIPDNMTFGINTHSLTDNPDTPTFRYATLQLPVGKYCIINTYARNAVYIGRSQEVIFIKKGNGLFLLSGGEGFSRVGEIVFGSSRAPANSLPLTGGWKLKTDYPRIFDWHVNVLDPSELGAGADDIEPDADNRTKWIIGINKFWVKDVGGLFLRPTDPDGNIDPVRLPGGYQADDNKAHNHVTAPWDKAGAKASDITGEATPGSLDSNNPSTEYRVGQMGSYWTAATIQSQGTEARPKNVAQNCYVII
jgi:hypothetical protein